MSKKSRELELLEEIKKSLDELNSRVPNYDEPDLNYYPYGLRDKDIDYSTHNIWDWAIDYS